MGLTVNELIALLNSLTEEQKNMQVWCSYDSGYGLTSIHRIVGEHDSTDEIVILLQGD